MTGQPYIPVALLNPRWDHQLVRRASLYSRLIALTLAVGLGALLVGLSVAPDALPGNTVRVQPRDLAGAVVKIIVPGSHLTNGAADGRTPNEALWLPAIAAFLLMLPLAGAVMHRPGPTLVARRPRTDECRAPPTLR
jgi:hypothetical protein